jgi:hypothetical protein
MALSAGIQILSSVLRISLPLPHFLAALRFSRRTGQRARISGAGVVSRKPMNRCESFGSFSKLRT